MAIERRLIAGVLKDMVSEGIVENSLVPMMVSHSQEIGVNSTPMPYIFAMVKEIAKGHLFENIVRKLDSPHVNEQYLFTEDFKELVITEMQKTNLSHFDLMRNLSRAVTIENTSSISKVDLDDILFLERYIVNKKLEELGHGDDKVLGESVIKYIHLNVKYDINIYDYSLIFWEYYYDTIAEFVSDLYNPEIKHGQREELYNKILGKLKRNYKNMFTPKYIDKNKNIVEFIKQVLEGVDSYFDKNKDFKDMELTEDEMKELKAYEKTIYENHQSESLHKILRPVFRNSKAPYVFDYTHYNIYIRACLTVDLQYPTHVEKMREIRSKYDLNELKFSETICNVIEEYYLDELRELIKNLDSLPLQKENHVRSNETAEKFGKMDKEYNSLILAEHRILNISKFYPTIFTLKYQKTNMQILLSSIYETRVNELNKKIKKKSPRQEFDETTLTRMGRIEYVLNHPENAKFVKSSGIVRHELSNKAILKLLILTENGSTYTLIINPGVVVLYSGDKNLYGRSSLEVSGTDVFNVSDLSSTVSQALKHVDLAEGRKNKICKIIMTGYSLQYKNLIIK